MAIWKIFQTDAIYGDVQGLKMTIHSKELVHIVTKAELACRHHQLSCVTRGKHLLMESRVRFSNQIPSFELPPSGNQVTLVNDFFGSQFPHLQDECLSRRAWNAAKDMPDVQLELGPWLQLYFHISLFSTLCNCS